MTLEVLAKQREDALTVRSTLDAMPKETQIEKMCKVFQLLADPVRLKIVSALLQGDMCVGFLTEVCGVSQSGVSHQLRVLRDNNIVRCKRLGQRVEYSIADEHIREIVEMSKAHLHCANGEGVWGVR